MATQSRKDSAPIIKALIEEPRRFDFFQAVRLLELDLVLKESEPDSSFKDYKYPVSKSTMAAQERIKFANNYELTFQTSEIKSINIREVENDNSSPIYQLVCNFMGLAGSGGVMPYQFSELILKRIKLKDRTLSRFMDLINHRTISLFYQAWTKYRLPISWERSQLFDKSKDKTCQFDHILHSIMGLETKELDFKFLDKNTIKGYAGILSQANRNAINLENLLRDYYQFPVKLIQFVLERSHLEDECLTKIGTSNTTMSNNQLSAGAFLGSLCWMTQNKFRVVISLNSHADMIAFSPSSNKLRGLVELIVFYVGIEMTFDIVFAIQGKKLPGLQLIEKSKYRPTLGWNSYLKPTNKIKQQEILKIRITPSV